MSSTIEARLAERGLVLPPPIALPAGVSLPFSWVRTHGGRALVSGHGALDDTGHAAAPFGTVPSQVAVAEAQASACRALLAVLASVRRAVGDLDRIEAWLSVTAFVNAERGFEMLTLVANPMSELIVELFGPERGAHARTSPGVSALPFNLPVIVTAELAIR